jgi:eukaryotic-like serine/threonine-protein kinase
VPRPPTPTKREGAGQPPPPERFEPKAGLVVAGKYCVEQIIGEGGMGVVASATHVGLDQKVAIKFLLPEAMRSEEVVERFLREAKVAAKVNSEHVARVSDVGKVEPDGVPFIVMEYLEGSDLGAMIDAEGKLSIDEACEIGLQACEALAEVHDAGIVHRDLKPSNLFVTRRADGSPCVKLLDFGISKFTVHPDDETVDPALTATATIMGSPSYMSPEQLKSTKEVDARTDVWALGAVLYEAVSGRPAFRGETVPQVCFMIGSEDPAPPSSLRADMPPDLERAILACLDKKVDTRSTLVDLARALVVYAPPRARVSLERVEATLGAAPAPPPKKRDVSLPVVPLATHDAARTQQSWHGEEPKSKRKKKGGSGATLLLFLVVVAAGVFGVGVYTGRIDVSAMRGEMTGAASAVGTVVASATAAVESAIPTALPSSIPIPLPSAIPIPSTLGSIEVVPPDSSASDETDEDDDDDAAADSATPPAASHLPPGHPQALPAHVVAPARHAPHKPRRKHKKTQNR